MASILHVAGKGKFDLVEWNRVARAKTINRENSNLDSIYRGMHSLVTSKLNEHQQYRKQNIRKYCPLGKEYGG